MWTMWDAPSDRDYRQQFHPELPEDEYDGEVLPDDGPDDDRPETWKGRRKSHMRITIDIDILEEEQAWSLRIDGGDRETLSTQETFDAVRRHLQATMDVEAAAICASE